MDYDLHIFKEYDGIGIDHVSNHHFVLPNGIIIHAGGGIRGRCAYWG